MAPLKGFLNHGDQAARDVSTRFYGAVDAESDLDAIPSDKRYDGMGAIVIGDSTLWFFDKDSAAAGSAGSVRVPASGSGRWLRIGASTTAAITTLIADLASTANGKGASDIGVEDAGSFTAVTDVEAALAEIYQHLKTVQGHIDLDPQDFILLTGAPLAIFADGASAVPGTDLVDSKVSTIRWNNNGTLNAVLTSFRMPPDADITANATLTIFASKTGATLADAVTFDVGAFNQVVGALHDADADFGGTSGAMTGDAAAKTIQSVTLTLALADLAASPASVTLTIKPTDGTLGTDDLAFLGARISYKRKLLTS